MPHLFEVARQSGMSIGDAQVLGHLPDSAAIDPNFDTGDANDILQQYLDMQSDADAGRAENVSTTGSSSTTGTTQRSITGDTSIKIDESVNQITRTFFEVPTAEAFLNSFSNAFAGFAQRLGEAGLSGADIKNMLDPASGFMQNLLTDYMGDIAERAAKGENPFEVVGLEGDPEFLGERAGRKTERDIVRITETEAEQILRDRGQTVTSESINSVIDEDFQSKQSTLAASTDNTATTKESTTTKVTGKESFEEIEQLFRRPELASVFKFSPTDFLQERFGADEGGLSVGRVATAVRANAPRRRPIGSSVAVSARRA